MTPKTKYPQGYRTVAHYGFRTDGRDLPIEQAWAEMYTTMEAGGEAYAVGDLFTRTWQVYKRPPKKGRKAAKAAVDPAEVRA